MANQINLHAYRVEQLPNGTYGLNGVFAKAIKASDVKEVTPVNTLDAGAINLTGLGMLYGRIVESQPGLDQEFYVMQTVAQVNTLLNA